MGTLFSSEPSLTWAQGGSVGCQAVRPLLSSSPWRDHQTFCFEESVVAFAAAAADVAAAVVVAVVAAALVKID